jgi:putative heme utilization carrier protein HutX
MTATPELDPVREALSKHPGVILESLARQHGVSYQAALACLSDEMQTQLPGSCFDQAMADMTDWGDLVVIVHTADLVMEVKGPLPPGRFGSGFYNLEAETGLSGHIRAERCGAVAFVRRPFMGKDSVSVQFLNQEGGCMFKVFVGRDTEGRLNPAQVERWEQLRSRLAAVASA